VKEKVPTSVPEVTVKFTFLLAPGARVKLVWLKTPVGPPVTSAGELTVTKPVMPPRLVTVTMENALVKAVPASTVKEVGFAATEKSTT
jgi:hypothetical protein